MRHPGLPFLSSVDERRVLQKKNASRSRYNSSVLLDKIIELATDADKPLTVLLRQCVILGHELKNDSLKMWANQELNGYAEPEKMPEYRVIRTGATGLFSAGYRFPTIKRPIPAALMHENHRWAATEAHLCEPISSYENVLKNDETKGELSIPWSADMVTYYQAKFIKHHVLTQAWQDLSRGVIIGLLDTVRTRVLNVALDIKSEIGDSDADLKKVPSSSEVAERVDHIIINHIYGGTVFVGDQQSVNVQNISAGNWEDLKKALLSRGIQDPEISELSKAIEQDGKTLGVKSKEWITRNATKVWDHGLQLGTTVGAAVLTEYVKKHLGLS